MAKLKQLSTEVEMYNKAEVDTLVASIEPASQNLNAVLQVGNNA
jgi:hypothetical protein